MSSTVAGELRRQAHALLGLRGVQVLSGLLGQLLLLGRWSPHSETDAFLTLSRVPWLLLSLLLVSGLDLALPAAYHRAAARGAGSRRALLVQVLGLILLAAGVASLLTGAGVMLGGAHLGLARSVRAPLALLWAATIPPLVLTLFGQGVLIARERLVAARWVLVVQSVLTLAGYALLPPASGGTGLAGITLLAALGGLSVTLSLLRPARPETWRRLSHGRPRNLHPEVPRLLGALLSLGAAAALVHIQGLLEQTALLSLGPGGVTAFVAAAHGWEVALTLVVAGGVLPAYARWAQESAARPGDLLRWTLLRALALTGAAALLGGGALWMVRRQSFIAALGLDLAPVAAFGLALLPRFVLLGALQPLIYRHYARGTPWMPVLGTGLGIPLLAAGAFTLIPRWGLRGVAVATTLGVLPGWAVLGCATLRERRRCAS